MINKYLGILQNASQHGSEVDNLFEYVHWFMLLLFVGWAAFFICALIRFRRSRNPQADYVGVTSKTSTYVELGVVVVEAILLLGFAFPLWARRVNEFPLKENATVVYAVAQQFAWNFRYPGPDGILGKQDANLVSANNPFGLDQGDPHGKDDIVTLNQMHVPVNKPVIVHISSKDVVHSFAVRQMRVTQDAIPGMSIPFWFTPVRMGTYEISCVQLCGIGHYQMRGFLTVDTPENYERWLKEQAAATESNGGSGSYE